MSDLKTRFWPWLTTVAYAIAPPGHGEDYAQEGLIAIWTSLQGKPAPDALDAWAKTVAKRRMLSVSRSERSAMRDVGLTEWVSDWDPYDEQGLAPGTAPADLHVVGAHASRAIVAAVAELTPKQRTCTVLKFWGDLGDKEIANCTDIARPDSTWRKARANLRETLAHLETAA